MNKLVTVGLLTPFFAPLTGYEEAANELKLRLVVVTPHQIRWKTKQVEGLIWQGEHWIKRVTSLPSALYNRYYSPKPPVVDALEKIIGENKVFNHVTRFDKWDLYNILANSALQDHLPPTSLFSSETLVEYLENYGSAILKPRRGHLGYKILLVRKDQTGYHLHQGSKYPTASYASLNELSQTLNKAISPNYLIQKFIPFSTINERIFDLRFLVQKDQTGTWQITGCVSRVALSYSYITNISVAIISGEQALQTANFPENLLDQLKQLSIKGAQIAEQSLGSLGEISVDFALDQQGEIWLIEVNGKPTKSIFKELHDETTLKQVYQMPLAYARYLATE